MTIEFTLRTTVLVSGHDVGECENKINNLINEVAEESDNDVELEIVDQKSIEE